MVSKLFERYETNKELEEEGVVVDFGDGIQVKVARFTSKRAKEVRAMLEKPYRRQIEAGTLPAEIAEEITHKQMAKAIILGWSGVTDKDGKELDCNYENILYILKALPDFAEEIATAALARETFLKQEQDEEVKN